MKKLVRFDWAIKRLLRNKANFGILEGFLSELLGDDIKIDSILESEGNKETAENKFNPPTRLGTGRVDLLVQDSKAELIIIELQSDYMQDYLMRMLFGTSKIIVDNMQEGMLYSQIKKIISVNIVYFDLGHGMDYIYHGSTNFLGMNRHDVLNLSWQEQQVYHTELIYKIYPEYYIVKVNQFDNIARNTLDEWIQFLKTEEIKEGTKAKGLIEAKEKLDVLKLTREQKLEYDRYIANWRDTESVALSNYKSGEIKGIERGIQIGAADKEQFADERVKQEKLEIARECLRNGMSVEMTARLTKLSEEEVRDIRI